MRWATTSIRISIGKSRLVRILKLDLDFICIERMVSDVSERNKTNIQLDQFDKG